MQYLILLMSFLCAQIALAIPVPETLPQRSWGLGLSSLYLQQADFNRAQRFRLDAIHLETFHHSLRWENQISWAPDRQNYPGALSLRQHLYEWTSGLRYSYPYLFRYGLSLAPMLRFEQTELVVKTNVRTEQSYSRWTLGWKAAATLDYAIHRDWEINFYLAYLSRPISNKADFVFGAILLRNTPEPQ
jgi:hypothetical protein